MPLLPIRVVRALLPAKEHAVNDVQMGMSVTISREALNFQASMAAAVINGSINKGQEMQALMGKDAGLAAQGIGSRLNIEV